MLVFFLSSSAVETLIDRLILDVNPEIHSENYLTEVFNIYIESYLANITGRFFPVSYKVNYIKNNTEIDIKPLNLFSKLILMDYIFFDPYEMKDSKAVLVNGVKYEFHQ